MKSPFPYKRGDGDFLNGMTIKEGYFLRATSWARIFACASKETTSKPAVSANFLNSAPEYSLTSP